MSILVKNVGNELDILPPLEAHALVVDIREMNIQFNGGVVVDILAFPLEKHVLIVVLQNIKQEIILMIPQDKGIAVVVAVF